MTDGHPLSCFFGNHSTAAAEIANVSPPQTHYCRKVAIYKNVEEGSRSLLWWWGWRWFCRLLITAGALAVWNPGTEGGAAGIKGWLPTLSCARPHSQSATTAIWLSLPGPLSAVTPLFRHPPFSPTIISLDRDNCAHNEKKIQKKKKIVHKIHNKKYYECNNLQKLQSVMVLEAKSIFSDPFRSLCFSCKKVT